MTQLPPRVLDPFAAEFWRFTENREFRLQQCSECQKLRWPPLACCDRCLSEQYEWGPVSGRGTLLSWVVFHRPYFPEYPPPHIAISVELDEGPLFVSTPTGVKAGDLRDGLPMQLDWREAEDRFGSYQLPIFRPLDSVDRA